MITGFLRDLNGKPSTMRATSMATVAGAVVMLIGGASGYFPMEAVTAEHALIALGLGFGAKAWQRGTEATQQMEKKE